MVDLCQELVLRLCTDDNDVIKPAPTCLAQSLRCPFSPAARRLSSRAIFVSPQNGYNLLLILLFIQINIAI